MLILNNMDEIKYELIELSEEKTADWIKGIVKMFYNRAKKNNKKLYRIRALKDFSDVKAGDLGGFVESEDNLSHEGDCWIYNDNIVTDSAKICQNAKILSKKGFIAHEALVQGNTKITGITANIYNRGCIAGNVVINNASIHANCWIEGNVTISDVTIRDNFTLKGDAKINSDKDYFVLPNKPGERERNMIYTASNKKWCLYYNCKFQSVTNHGLLKLTKDDDYTNYYKSCIELAMIFDKINFAQ